MLGGERQESQMAGPLDGCRQLALMTGADGRLPPGLDLSPVG